MSTNTPLSLTDAVAAVQEHCSAYSAADAAVRKHDEAAERERAKRAAAKQRLYELVDDAAADAATSGAVRAILKQHAISLPPSKR